MTAPDRDKLADAIDDFAAARGHLGAALDEYIDGRHECSESAACRSLDAANALARVGTILGELWREANR